MKPESILPEAAAILCGDRQTDYGDAVANFANIAEIASRLAGRTITPSECVKVLIAMKLGRESFRHKRDNLVDAAAYLEILRQVVEYENEMRAPFEEAVI